MCDAVGSRINGPENAGVFIMRHLISPHTKKRTVWKARNSRLAQRIVIYQRDRSSHMDLVSSTLLDSINAYTRFTNTTCKPAMLSLPLRRSRRIGLVAFDWKGILRQLHKNGESCISPTIGTASWMSGVESTTTLSAYSALFFFIVHFKCQAHRVSTMLNVVRPRMRHCWAIPIVERIDTSR